MSIQIDVGKRWRKKLRGRWDRNRWMDVVRFYASSPGPGEQNKQTNKQTTFSLGHTTSFHSKYSYQFHYNYDFCDPYPKQSHISTCKSKEWINQDCWLTFALLFSVFPSTLPPSASLTRTFPSPQKMMSAGKNDCSLRWAIGILPLVTHPQNRTFESPS